MCVGKAAHVCGYSVLETVWVASLPPTQIRKRMSTPMVMDLTNMHCALIDGKYDIQRKCHMHKYSSAIVLCSTKKKKFHTLHKLNWICYYMDVLYKLRKRLSIFASAISLRFLTYKIS